MVSLIDLFAACQTVEPRDEEEVGPPPSPGYSYSCVPIWHEGSRTGRGNNFKQDSFLPLSISQVRKEFWCTHLQNCMGLVQAYPNCTIQLLPCKVKILCLYSAFLSPGYLLEVLVLTSGWKQLVKWIVLVFMYVDDEGTRECLHGWGSV